MSNFWGALPIKKQRVNMIDIEKITRELFSVIEYMGYKYCVYNGYEWLPYKIKTDLDIAIEKKVFSKLDSILLKISKRENLLLLHKIWHDENAISYMLSPPSLSKPDRLQLDFFSEFSSKDFRSKNLLESLKRFHILEEEELLENFKKELYYNVPSPSKEFLFKLLRRIIKEDMDKDKIEKLFCLYKAAPRESQDLLEDFFPDEITSEVIGSIIEKNPKRFQNLTPILKKGLHKKKSTLPRFSSIKRAIFRFKYPVGFSVAFIGPDGSGKSTVAKEIIKLLSRSFQKESLFYWRPGFLRPPGVAFGIREEEKNRINLDPHGHKLESPLKSLFRLFYYLIDFTMGYFLKVHLNKVKKCLCIFDRYYHDILVDSFRYNFSLPSWLLKLSEPLIPKPDIAFFVYTPSKILYERKQELPKEELERQNQGFMALKKHFPSFYLIDNTRPLKVVLEKISSIILLNKAYQTYWILNLKEGDSGKYIDELENRLDLSKKPQENSVKLTYFPTASKSRIFVPIENYRHFKSSISLYNPNRPFAKLAYKMAPKALLYQLYKKNNNSYYFNKDSGIFRKLKEIFPQIESVAIYTGAPGPHRKPLLQLMDKNGEILIFIKLAINERTEKLIKREEGNLKRVKNLKLRSATIPSIITSGRILKGNFFLAIEPFGEKYKKSWKIGKPHIEFLKEMFEKTGGVKTFKETDFFQELGKRVEFLRGKIPYWWTLRYERMLDFYKDTEIPVYFSHGDFTPWNAFITNGDKLLLFDWEYRRKTVFPGDLFYFIIQREIFSARKVKKTSKILNLIKREIKQFSELNLDGEDLLLILLIDVSSYFFKRNIEAEYVEEDMRSEEMYSFLMDKIISIKEITI